MLCCPGVIHSIFAPAHKAGTVSHKSSTAFAQENSQQVLLPTGGGMYYISGGRRTKMTKASTWHERAVTAPANEASEAHATPPRLTRKAPGRQTITARRDACAC